jgi:predicted metal-dependent hydrolase
MTQVLTVGKTDIPYELRFSGRAKHKRIEVTPGRVLVVVPRGTRLKGSRGVHAFLDEKRRWVFDSVREIEEKHRRVMTQQYASGAKLQYRGRWLMLDVQPGGVDRVEIRCRSKFHVVVPKALSEPMRAAAVADAFDLWLRERAMRDVLLFGHRHEANLGVAASGYRLTNARRRWGSCAANNVVRVHWRLVQAPRMAMEYVVAHEVAHLVHRNHSAAFWGVLARTMPRWSEAKELLKRWELGHRAV